MISSYGEAYQGIDNNISTLFKDPEDWMYSLYRKERYLLDLWKQPNFIIGIEAIASSTSQGNVRLIYEHALWSQILSKKELRENSLL